MHASSNLLFEEARIGNICRDFVMPGVKWQEKNICRDFCKLVSNGKKK